MSITREFDKDSIIDSKYFLKKLCSYSNFNNKVKVIRFYKYRLKYEYYVSGISGKQVDFFHLDEIEIKVNEIKSTRLLELQDGHSVTGIDNQLTLKDSIWMNTKPIKIDLCSCEINSCSFRLFSHEYNNEIKKLIHTLKLECSKELKEGEGRNEEVYKIIAKITKFKVIVISTCYD